MMETVNYAAELHEYAQKRRYELRFEERSVGPDHNITFIIRAVLNVKAYPDGVGKNKKEAKQNAAKNALKCLMETEHQDSVKTTADDKNCASAQQMEKVNRNVSDISNKIRRLNVTSQPYGNQQRQREQNRETNFIGLVDHYCQKKRLCHSYIEERRDGSPHNPVFFYKVLINNKEYPVGEGKIVKEAKQKAAQLAWSALQEQTDWDSKVSVRSTVSEDATSPMFSAQSTTLESHESSSQRTSMNTSATIIFDDSSNLSKAQIPIGSAVCENAPSELSTSLESLSSAQSMSTGTSGSGIFTDSSNSSKDQHVVKDMKMGKSQNETSTQSRFTSEFDSIERLGSGGFGRVYKARDKLLKKYYAVKIVCCVEKALREVGTLSDLLHCNIVRYYTFWMDASRYQWDSLAGSNSSVQSLDNSSAKYLYIQMELCNTKTLKDWIDEKNTQSPQDSKRREESLSIAQQIVSGVEYIHSKEHIHRDLKPENILFGLDGVVKIGDFGLVTKDDEDDSALMDRTEDKGTSSYMAPEQREKYYDRRVDIFALGLIYFELLWKLSTGHERVVVWNDARSQKFPEDFLQTFPQEKNNIELMLRENPEDRPDASKVKAELEKCAQTFSTKNVRQENATI
ncbi:interferon-induced, double-stranded RNA-activated protein kinase-like isoform X3 [Etheostoma cragini]|uniref:interferon-induced, double-stranded RNA-activated protein kinase-like isoform X3 n=1 Tax=Etheostoma cragini TaxID=417921 RepID=UPI00155E849A|nr:interferon-induced, double-stranded RNA-activated protein kinase-like isoform X3 [Etheostoma cragini]